MSGIITVYKIELPTCTRCGFQRRMKSEQRVCDHCEQKERDSERARREHAERAIDVAWERNRT